MPIWSRLTGRIRQRAGQETRLSPAQGAPRGATAAAIRNNAWGIVVRPGGLKVRAGPQVEMNADFLAEGAWAGPFSAEGILTSPFRCGSGAVFDESRIVVFGPSHPVEQIYCFVGRGYLVASNSIHLAIAMSEGSEPTDIETARNSAATIVMGSHRYDRILYVTEAGTMFRLAYGTWSIDRQSLRLSETLTVATAAPDFADYAGYRALLAGMLRAMIDNARSQLRRLPYGDLITTCSAGYDSPACAALAKELGCREALTIRTARSGPVDSGRPVAESLGLVCHEYERFGHGLETKPEGGQHHFVDGDQIPESYSEFLASVHPAGELWMAPFEKHLPRRILLTGFHGDKVWAKGCPSGPTIKRGDTSGSGIDEFRKRVGFVHVPVPFIGAANDRALATLFDAEEMRPYRVDRSYDRPVPRRIAEEAGVPRDLFGNQKMAGSVMFVKDRERRNEAFLDLLKEYRKGIKRKPGGKRKTDGGGSKPVRTAPERRRAAGRHRGIGRG